MFRGFFNRMYNGNPNRPDVDPDDMPKNRFELFFTTLGLRFGDLIKLNLLFVVTILPLLLWTAFVFYASNMYAASQNVPNLVTNDAVMMPIFMQSLSIYLMGLLIFLPLAGPPLAGLTYIVRNYARDEHVWLWSDFKEQMKLNWKQSVAAMLVLALVLYLAFLTMQLYSVTMGAQNYLIVFLWQFGLNYGTQSSTFMWVMEMLFVLFLGLFVLSYMYIFPLLVTYKLKFGQVMRNGLMIALGRLPFTILFGVFTILPLALGIFLWAFTSYALIGLVIYYLLLGFSLAAFVINSYTNATFDKLLKVEDEPASQPEDDDKEVKP